MVDEDGATRYQIWFFRMCREHSLRECESMQSSENPGRLLSEGL